MAITFVKCVIEMGQKHILQTPMNDFHVKITNVLVEIYSSSHVKVHFVLEFKFCFKTHVT